MKENNTIEEESLEDAISRFYPVLFGETSYDLEMETEAFVKGTKWQKEKDKVIIDKLIEALKDSQYYLETAINATPTGTIRNILTEANIRSLSVLQSLNQ